MATGKARTRLQVCAVQRQHAHDVHLRALRRRVQRRAVQLRGKRATRGLRECSQAKGNHTNAQLPRRVTLSLSMLPVRTRSRAFTSALFSSSITPTARQPRSHALCSGVRPSCCRRKQLRRERPGIRVCSRATTCVRACVRLLARLVLRLDVRAAGDERLCNLQVALLRRGVQRSAAVLRVTQCVTSARGPRQRWQRGEPARPLPCVQTSAR